MILRCSAAAHNIPHKPGTWRFGIAVVNCNPLQINRCPAVISSLQQWQGGGNQHGIVVLLACKITVEHKVHPGCQSAKKFIPKECPLTAHHIYSRLETMDTSSSGWPKVTQKQANRTFATSFFPRVVVATSSESKRLCGE